MDKINPTQYITDVDPVPEEVIDASGWFETEYLTIEQRWNYDSNVSWGPFVGNYLPWYLAQGWVIEEMTSEDIGPRYGVYRYMYTLKRRKLQSERVLQSLITDFTEAYNEGREVNDTRYDELVTLYSTMLDKSEDQLTTGEAGDTEYDGLIETIIGSMSTDYEDHAEDVDGALDGYGDSIRDQINARFDGQLATSRQQLADRGMYNSTVWEGIEAGIERERSLALTDLEDKITQQQLALKQKTYADKTSMRAAIMAARDRLHSKLQAAADQRLGTRNAILTAMLSFMERRQDDYPELSGLADIAARLGYGDTPNTVMP